MHVKPKWLVSVTTGDHFGLFKALRAINAPMAEYAINHASRMHDDDPDSDMIVSIPIGKMSELRDVLNALDSQKHIESACIYVRADNGGGVHAEYGIGPWGYSKPDESFGEINVRKEAVVSTHESAMREAIKIMESSLG